MIKLYNELYIADPWPAAYLKDHDMLIIADLHLGIEGALEEEGLYLPRKVSEATAENVYKMLESLKPYKLIIAGDLKHSFGLLNASEWIEIKKFLYRLREDYDLDVIVIRGNHDNYLGVVLDKFGIPFYERYDIKEYSIIHGHMDIDLEYLNNIIIMGHEHPSITIRDEIGIKYKFKCFLWGEFNNKKILILPSLSELATGSTFNEYELVQPLSPLLNKIDIGLFKPFPIVIGELVKELPTLKDLKNLV